MCRGGGGGGAVADPEYARGGGVSHILAEKGLLASLFSQKMHENAIFSPISWGGGGVEGLRRVPACTTTLFQR